MPRGVSILLAPREGTALSSRVCAPIKPARVCARGAKGRQARARLTRLLASFVEGFDTADLQDAQRLLGR